MKIITLEVNLYFTETKDVLYYENFNLRDLKTPVKVEVLEHLLMQTNYDPEETKFLINGFKNGFEIGYEGDRNVQMKAPNLKLNVGTKVDLWNKVMKEVKAGRYAGPFENIPFENYIQSPIGLVPKDGGLNTRLIFHLSYPRIQCNLKQKSVNGCTPKWKTTVKYPDFADAVRLCLKIGPNCEMAKSDLKSAFRHFCIRKEDWCLLIMKAVNPLNNKTYYFVDKCMPFGAAISCSHFQRFSNALAHITKSKTGKETVNYLDDFFFVALLRVLCNKQVKMFTTICDLIQFPWSLEKTHWASTRMSFLGLLLDSSRQKIFLPLEKIEKALVLINSFLSRKKGKVTLHEIQKLCGILNFFSRCIIPARAFTRRLYALTQGKNANLKAHHHIQLKSENKADLRLWEFFLKHPTIFNRNFTDFSLINEVEDLKFYTNASRNKFFGAGGYCEKSWYLVKWDSDFMEEFNPSINYLELYAVTVAVILWLDRFADRKIAIFCDNTSVIHMINNNTSSCKNCMVLIRIIVLKCLIHNVRLCAKYVASKENDISDSLSRLQMDRFYRLTKGEFEVAPHRIPEEIWPIEKIWLKQ